MVSKRRYLTVKEVQAMMQAVCYGATGARDDCLILLAYRHAEETRAESQWIVAARPLCHLHPPVDLNTSPAATHIFLTSIPGSLGLKIVPRQYHNIQRNHFPSASKLPRRVQSGFPRKDGVHIPKQ